MPEPEYYAALQPPLSDDRLHSFEELFGVTFSDDVRSLYQWKNGQTAMTDETLYRDRGWMQMEEVRYVVEPSNELLDMGEFEQAHWWSRQWLPFLRDGAGGYLCIDMEGTFGGSPGQLITYWEDRPDRTIEYPDLATFLAALLAGYEAAWSGDVPGPVRLAYPPGYPIAHRATS